MSACLHCGSAFSCRNANSHEEGFSSKGLRDNIFVCWCLKWAPVVLRVLRKKIFTGRVVSQALKWGSAGVIIPGSVQNMYGCGPWGRGGLGRVKLLVWLDGLRGLFQSYCSSLLFYFIFFFLVLLPHCDVSWQRQSSCSLLELRTSPMHSTAGLAAWGAKPHTKGMLI